MFINVLKNKGIPMVGVVVRERVSLLTFILVYCFVIVSVDVLLMLWKRCPRNFHADTGMTQIEPFFSLFSDVGSCY